VGSRLTVYDIYDYLREGYSRDHIKQYLLLSDAELDAAEQYIEAHRPQVEAEFAEILREAAEREAHYRKLQAERSPFPPDMPYEEKIALLKAEARRRLQSASATNGHHRIA
jgi:hypothetical protein